MSLVATRLPVYSTRYEAASLRPPPRLCRNSIPLLSLQRDFVYLLRNIRRQVDRAAAMGVAIDDTTPFSEEMLLSALRRNFGGITESAFALLATKFLQRCGFVDDAKPSMLSLQTVATLRESLHDVVDAGEDPNMAAFRHILLLDPTDVEVSLGVLFELGLITDRSSTCVVTLPEFASDASDLLRSQAVASIKSAAEAGQTVLLTNPAPIASSIFDLLNKHYLKLTVMDDHRVAHVKYYANIAIGSYSRLCAVSPAFRIIVHMPLSTVGRTPLPFLNRFEKYTLSCRVALEEKLSMMAGPTSPPVDHSHGGSTRRTLRPYDDRSLWRAVLDGVEDFATAIAAPVSMPGYVPYETASALILRALADSTDPVSNPLGDVIVRAPVRAWSSLSSLCQQKARELPLAEIDEQDQSESQTRDVFDVQRAVDQSVEDLIPRRWNEPRSDIRGIIRALNFQFLQLLRPENVLLSRLELPLEYRVEYVLRQVGREKCFVCWHVI